MDSHEQENCASPQTLERMRVIRTLNDKLRIDRKGGYYYVTDGVCSLGPGLMPEVIRAVAAFDKFTPDNDPYGEHDFGRLALAGHSLLWRIDYYDADMEFASSDPADPAVTTRVLTIMLASEY